MSLPIAPLRLTYAYFGAGPGMGGVAELSIRGATNSIEVTYSGDITDSDELPQHLLTIESADHWRQILVAIECEEVFALYTEGDTESGYPWPYQMTLNGSTNYVTELVAFAWAGPPVSSIAIGLSSASDAQLAELRQTVGSLLTRKFIMQALKVQAESAEVGLSFGEMVRRLNGKPIDLQAMKRDTKVFSRVLALESRAAQLRHEWHIQPFLDESNQIVAAWSALNKATSYIGSWGISAKRAALKRYIEEHIKAHKSMPTGTQNLTSNAFSTPLHFSVDFDALRQSL